MFIKLQRNMFIKLQKIFILLSIIFCSATIYADSDAKEADVFARNLIDKTFSILNDATMSGDAKNAASRTLLAETLDCEWMGNFVLGQYRRTITPEQKEKFLAVYKEFVLSYFSRNFASMAGSNFVVKATNQTGEGEYSVDCEAQKAGSAEKTSMQIMIRYKDNKFLAFDVVIEGISFISSQRAEYNSTISDKGIDFMTDHLKSLDKVSQFEQKNKVEIYTADYCPYCKTAKEFLKQHNIRFDEIDITNQQDVRKKISELSAIKTVPQIFVNGKFISDCSGLFEIKKRGQLEQIFFGS
jgi:ABC-type transporter MlaC component/glutaredoxin